MDWIVRSTWAYPALEALHIVGIALLLGSLVVFELRVWGVAGTIDGAALAGLVLPVTLVGFGLAAVTGALMFASQYDELLANRAFQIKLGLLALAGLNAGWFQWRARRFQRDAIARVQTALSLGLWIGIIMCGRGIAYV